MTIRLTDIENFLVISDSASLSEAARKIGVSQPSLSESLKNLETRLGQVLFYRSKNGIQLSPLGRIFLLKAKNASRAMGELKFNLVNDTEYSVAEIRIGCHSTVAQYVIPEMMIYLKKEKLNTHVKLMHDFSRNIQTKVQSGMVDVGIVINPVSVPDIVIVKLGIDTVQIWHSGEEERFDTVICDPNLYQTQHILKRWKLKPSKIIETDSLGLICKLVHDKIGYGILPCRAVQASGLKNIQNLEDSPKFQDRICLVYRPEFGKTQFEKKILTGIKKVFSNTPDREP